ncbi:hypothetical protein LSH36_416g00016 [Paralvinella palmiformis]|uniref:C-type lectin domain-containing protein n=1 Tax=Paralvinella palmiformis TaxID=53620 RepID=A0AAD9N0Y9_9ANNE|nr:hypothetical protein LSH36_416g00016 [Paralvinella palmiformis]
MFVEYILIIFFYCVSSSYCQHLKMTTCLGYSCYYLYEADNSYITWDKSLEFCTNNGMAMAKIQSNQTQMVIDTLLQYLPQSTQRQIWIGGRRSIDDSWRYMNGTEFNKQVTTPSQTASYCLYVKLCKGLAPEYHDNNCDEKTSHSRLLCQYDESKTDRCISSDSHFGDKCYRKTKYNGQEPNKIDWYNGETYCSESDIQGDIAYSYLDDDTLINNIINLVDGSKDCVQLWLGVRKRIWFWMTEIDSSDGDCIYIDRDKGNKWFTQSLRRRLQSAAYEAKSNNSKNNDVTTGTGILETPGLSTSNDVTHISTQIQQDTQDVQYEVIDGGREKRQNTEMSPDFVNIQRDKESDPYEKPSTYINMVDRPNVYQSLNNN